MRRRNKIEDIRYKDYKQSRPLIPQAPKRPQNPMPVAPPPQHFEAPANSKSKNPTPIHAPRNFKYLGFFDSIQRQLQQMLSTPNPHIPIELIHNNQQVAKIVGTAFVVEQQKESSKNRSYFKEEEYKEAVLTQSIDGSVRKQVGKQVKWVQQDEYYDRRQGRYEYQDIHIPEQDSHKGLFHQEDQKQGFQFCQPNNMKQSQFF